MLAAPWWEPQSFPVAMVTALVSTACWGSWTNTAKASGDRVNFAHYYVDYCIGSLLGTVALLLGPGCMQVGDQAVELHRGVFALAAGALFAVANLVLTTGIALAGLSIAFPVCIGTSLVLGTVLTYLVDRRGRPELIFVGLTLALGGILANARAYALRSAATPKAGAEIASELAADAEAPVPPKGVAPVAGAAAAGAAAGTAGSPRSCDAGSPRSCRSGAKTVEGTPLASAVAVIEEDEEAAVKEEPDPQPAGHGLSGPRLLILCVVGGLLMGSWSPLLAKSVARGPGLSPYASCVCFTMASFVVSVAVLAGQQLGCQLIPRVDSATSFTAYLRLPVKLHGWGILGGMIWAAGTVANLVGGGPLGFALSFALGQMAPVVAVLWGLLWYREFNGAPARAWVWLLLMFLLFAGAITLLVLGGR